MVKLKAPLMSLGAIGRLPGITFLRRRRQDIAEKTPVPSDVKSPDQLSWRHMYQKCAALWHTLSAAEKADWESLARSRHMTGFAYWQSQCLRPNPGIYLPLQGGTMQGNIDMAKYRILNLSLPVDDQEPITLAYTKAYIFPYLHYQGARVFHSAAYAIPHNTLTILAFNSERYDTNSIHDNVANNSRLTCQTDGMYIISFSCEWPGDAAGIRLTQILLNGTTRIGQWAFNSFGPNYIDLSFSTIYDLSVGDFVQIRVFQDSGGVLNIPSIGNYTPEFMMQRIGT